MQRAVNISLTCFGTVSVLCKFISPTVSTETMQLLLLCSQPSQRPLAPGALVVRTGEPRSSRCVLLPSVMFRVSEKVTEENRSFRAARDPTDHLIHLFPKPGFRGRLWQFCIEHHTLLENVLNCNYKMHAQAHWAASSKVLAKTD